MNSESRKRLTRKERFKLMVKAAKFGLLLECNYQKMLFVHPVTLK